MLCESQEVRQTLASGCLSFAVENNGQIKRFAKMDSAVSKKSVCERQSSSKSDCRRAGVWVNRKTRTAIAGPIYPAVLKDWSDA
jgi:hypothetical protein